MSTRGQCSRQECGVSKLKRKLTLIIYVSDVSNVSLRLSVSLVLIKVGLAHKFIDNAMLSIHLRWYTGLRLVLDLVTQVSTGAVLFVLHSLPGDY